ncbi:MAG: S8 family serine peptidase [Patescibacteria group bacterium]
MFRITTNHLYTVGISLLVALFLGGLFYIATAQLALYNRPIPLTDDSLAPPVFIANSQPSQQAVVETSLIAEKVDLQRKLIIPDSPADIARVEAVVRQAGGSVIESSSSVIVVKIAKETESEVMSQLESEQLVESVEVDYPVFITADQVDWGISKIEVPPVWTTTQASGVRVAIVDTGIDYSHPDLRGRYVGGYDFANNDSDPFDDHGHGTHVAGTVGADVDNGGWQGAAPQASLVAVKVLGADGTGYISDIIDGIDWAMAEDVQVMNFSLGTTYDSSALKTKLAEAQAQGIYLVAAAGNTSGGPLLYPAAYNSVIAVSATDSNDQFASFSSTGAELAAPGVAITSSIPGGYATWSGTSMAAPHVSASVALMIANEQENIRERLQQTALDLGTSGKDIYFGHGRVVAKPAVLGEDVQAPVITFIEPKNDSDVGTNINIALDIQDEFVVKAATVSANNNEITTWETDPYNFEWDASSFIDQEVTLVASAVDDSDNVGAVQIKLKVVSELEPSPSITPSPTASATILPVSQNSDQSTEVRQDSSSPAQEIRQDTYYAPQELPSVTNANQRNPQPSQSNTQSQSTEQSQGSDQRSGAQSRTEKPEVRGVSTESKTFWSSLRSWLGW